MVEQASIVHGFENVKTTEQAVDWRNLLLSIIRASREFAVSLTLLENKNTFKNTPERSSVYEKILNYDVRYFSRDQRLQ